MTTFVHIDYPTTHPGVERAISVARKFQGFGARLSQERGLAALLQLNFHSTKRSLVPTQLPESHHPDVPMKRIT